MASETRPGVVVVQELSETPAAVSAPTLAPVVVGPCYQIVEALESDGSLNADAKYTDEQYNQASLAIPQADLPDPRNNLDEVNVDEEQVGVRLYFGGLLTALARGSNGSTGSSFLKAVNLSTKAGIYTDETASTWTFDSDSGDILLLAFDLPNPSITSNDVSVTVTGATTPADLVDAINGAVGADVAEVIEEGNDYGISVSPGNYRVLISSVSMGATSSVTLRNNASAFSKLFGSDDSLDISLDHHIQGAGFRGQDDEDGDLITPWIEWFRGAYSNGATGTALTEQGFSDLAYAVQIDLDGVAANSEGANVTFAGSSPVVPLSAATATTDGDEFWADGAQVASGVVTVVEQTRFKVGTLNTALSSFDDEGNTTSAVYTTVEVNTPSHGSPFAPRYAYFIANNLEYGEVTPEGVAAAVTGSNEGLSAQGASIYTATVSSSWIAAWDSAVAQSISLGGATLTTQLTTDGVQADEAVFNFSEGANYQGAYASLDQVALDLNDGIDGVSVSAVASGANIDSDLVTLIKDTLVFVTDNAGSDQRLVLKTTGSNSVAANLGITSTLSASGKDVEFAEPAEVTGDFLTLPLPTAQTEALQLTVVDSFGTHSWSLDGTVDASHTTLELLGQALTGQVDDGGVFPLYLYNDSSSIQVATLHFIDADGDTITSLAAAVAGRAVFSSLQGGSSVSISIEIDDSGVDADAILLGFTDSSSGAKGLTLDTALTSAAVLGTGNQVQVDIDGATTLTYTAAGAVATPAELIEELNSNAGSGSWSADPTGILSFYLQPASDSVITNNVTLGFRILDGSGSVSIATSAPTAGTDQASIFAGASTAADIAQAASTDSGVDELSGTRLAFTLDENPYVYEVDFVSNSLQDGIDLINEAVGGATDIASEDGGALVLTSSFAGAASRVTVDDDATSDLTNANGEDAGEVLGLTGADDEGSGRPNPDFYQDGSGTVYVGANILRNRSTGYPYSISSAIADIYFDYVGLRLDVTSDAADASLLNFSDVATMDAAIGPITTENPLALACFLQLQNAPSQSVYALGVSEVSAAAEMGTVTAYAEALNFLESKDVYAIAPLTDDVFVQQLFATHVESMSQPEERGERICFLWQGQPSRAADESIQSGVDAETMGSDNAVLLTDNPVGGIIGAGVSDNLNISVDDGIYMELVIVELGATSVRNYSISSQNGFLSEFRTSFAAGENDDGFYSTTTLDGTSDLEGMTYSIRKRGDLLLVTGTTIPDYAGIAEAAAATGASYASRRVFHVYCDSADTSVDGVVTNVPGYYVCAAITGMVAEQAPQQPFTRLSMTGFSLVYGTDDTFSENQLDVIADGGRYVMINQGGRIASRHQRSTASTSIEARELSITKAIDYLAKGLRATNRVYIGRFVINPGFIDQLVMSNEGFLARSVQSGVVNAASLKSVLQDESAPDTVLIEVEVAPAYPCNKIRITIVS